MFNSGLYILCTLLAPLLVPESCEKHVELGDPL